VVPVASRRLARGLRYSGAPYGLVLEPYGAVTLSGPPFQAVRSPEQGPMSEVLQPQTSCDGWFGLFPVRSPLLGESRLISFPTGTEMFHFPALAHSRLSFQQGVTTAFTVAGFSHSGIFGSQSESDSPKLIAAVHALLRRPSPRHPPRALRYLPHPPAQPNPSTLTHNIRIRCTISLSLLSPRCQRPSLEFRAHHPSPCRRLRTRVRTRTILGSDA
jgi:hypothetical protein